MAAVMKYIKREDKVKWTDTRKYITYTTPEYTMDELKARNRRDLLTASECETRSQLGELTDSAKKWMTLLGIVSLLLLVLLGTIFGIVKAAEEPPRTVDAPVAEPVMAEESDALPAETGWEKEREAFLKHLAHSQSMEASAMADIHTDWHDSFADAPREYTGGHAHSDMSGKYRTLHVLNQTSRILSSASHALSDGDEAA